MTEKERQAMEQARKEAWDEGNAYLMEELQKEKWSGYMEAIVREAGFESKGDVEAELARARVKTRKLFGVESTLKEAQEEESGAEAQDNDGDGDHADEQTQDQAQESSYELPEEYWTGYQEAEAEARQDRTSLGVAQALSSMMRMGKPSSSEGSQGGKAA